MKNLTVLIFLIVTTLTFGQTEPKKVTLHNDAQTMRQELIPLIPKGSQVAEAQEVLQAIGFVCLMKQQKGFIEMKDDKSVVEHPNQDFLLCDKRTQLLTKSRLWQVAVVHQDGIVSDVLNTVDTSPVLQKKDYIQMADADIRKMLLKYAPIGSSEDEVKKMLRRVFRRSYEKNTHYSEKDLCQTCPKEQGGFTLEANMQNYGRLQNLFLAGNYVLAVWYFDKNGVLADVKVSHEWDGV